MFGRKRGIYSMIGAAAEAAAATLFSPFDFGGGLGGFGSYAKDGDDTTAGGGGNDTTKGGAGDDDPPPVPTVPKSEADKAFRARDDAKKAFKAMVAMLGYDPAHTKLTETGDAENPWKVEVDGEDVTEEFKGKKKAGGKKDNADDLAKAEAKYKNRLAAANEGYLKRESGLIKIIDRLAVLTPLRAALQANDAVDSGGEAGEYSDVVELARKSLRTEVTRDDDGLIALDESGNPTVTVTPMNADGTPMVDSAGKAVSIDVFVKKFLEKRPVFKKNRRPGGPGAGASNVPAGGRASVSAGAREAGFSLFGLKPTGNNGQ